MTKVINTPSHGNGTTRLAFSTDGSRVFTGGQDCIVRIWDTDGGADKEPTTAAEAEAPVTWIAAAEDLWLSSSEDSEVRRYTKDSASFEAPVTSAAGVAVRCIAIDPQARKVAVASDELFVKVVDLESILTPQKLEGYTSPIRAIAWHPSGDLLTTCTQDGKIVIWDMTQTPPKREKVIEGIIPVAKDESAPEFSYDCSVVWHTSGQHFFVASKAHEIVTISRSDWARVPGSFTDKDAVGAITALALSPNGTYLLSASKSTVFVWSTQTRFPIAKHAGTQGSTITQLAFSPRKNLIAWTDDQGGLTRWLDPVPDNLPDPIRPDIATRAGASITVTRKGADLFGDDDLLGKGKNALDDDGDLNVAGLDDDEMELDLDKDWIVDDLDGAFNDDKPAAEVGGKAGGGYVKEMVSITKAQPPFQPGSTPFQNKKRYLAYNMLGVIEATESDIHQIINVVFFNQSTRSSFHFTDHFKIDMAYLGECGAVFACPPEPEHSARVLFKPYSSTAQEWTYNLRPETRVLGVAAGGLAPNTFQNNKNTDLQGYGNVVVATSENDLTFMSGTGRERRILALPGDFVTMVAAPEWVLVVYRPGSTTIDGSQNLYYIVINFEDFSVRQRDALPVPKGHTLKWIGLTEEGLPAMYDSKGYLHVLSKVRIPHHAAWVRILDANILERRQGKEESYWPVGITDDKFMCLILKGNQEYPGFPRPLIQELEIRLPFRQADAREEGIERNLLYVQTALDSLEDDLTTDTILTREQAIDKEFILLIQAACKSGNVPRAIELCKLLHNLPTFDAAIAIADFYNLPGFKEKAQYLKVQKEENEDRLVVARNKRRRWLRPDPPMRQLAVPPTNYNGYSNGGGSFSSGGGLRFDPLADLRPPPQIERPGMSRVTKPVIEKTRFMAPSTQTGLAAPSSSAQPWTDDQQTLMTDAPTQAEKRKRDVEDDEGSFAGARDMSMPPPKTTKSNPFARKAGQETNRNPFARGAENNKSLHKSESFFDKVDAAETTGTTSLSKKRASAKGKERESTSLSAAKSTGPKQATLFGMLPPKKSTLPSKSKANGKPAAADNESQQSIGDDVMMSDVNVTPLDSQNWEETQLVDEETQSAES